MPPFLGVGYFSFMENPALILPEFIGFFAGILLTFLLWLSFFSRAKKSRHNLEILQINLAKLNLAWSSNEGNWITKADYDADKDSAREKRSYLILASLLCLISWVGFVFSLILMASFRWLPSRKEKQIMGSELVRETHLTPAQVQQILDQVSV